MVPEYSCWPGKVKTADDRFKAYNTESRTLRWNTLHPSVLTIFITIPTPPMFVSFEEFTVAAAPFIQQCDAFIAKHGLHDAMMIDHLCYKGGSASEYEQMRAMLEATPPSAFVYQVQLSGRRVAYVGLREGVVSSNNSIRFIELSDKKPGVDESAGFHHVGIYPTTSGYDQLIQKLGDGGEIIQRQYRPHHTTHDLVLPGGFILRLTQRPLIEKIVEEQLSLIR